MLNVETRAKTVHKTKHSSAAATVQKNIQLCFAVATALLRLKRGGWGDKIEGVYDGEFSQAKLVVQRMQIQQS